MNPTLEAPKASNPVAPKRALPEHKAWQLDFRYVRILLILVAIACSLVYWHERFEHPVTDDAYIQADVIRVAAQVNGPLKKIEIADNHKVRQGQELLQIDPEPFQIAVDKAKADYVQALQDLESLRDEVENARATLALAEADAQVTDDSWRAIAYFKETVLHKIRPGQKAKIELVAYPGHVFHGVVQGVGWGITEQDVVLS